MSIVRQKIYILLFIVLIACMGLIITKAMTDQSHVYTAPESQDYIVPNITPGQAKNIDWDTTEKLMSNCQIKVIFQKHTLEITIRDRNGQIYQTNEPKIDAIFDLAKKYQGPCDIIQMITE